MALSWSRKFDGEPSEKVIRNYFDPSKNKVTKNSYPKNAKFCGPLKCINHHASYVNA